MTDTLLIQAVRPWGGAGADILVERGRITAIGPGLAAPPGTPVLAGADRIAIPGLVEAHTHLDKNLLGLPWYRNAVGPRLIDKIDNERTNKRALDMDPARQSARQALQSLAFGSTHIRSHVDVDTENGLWGIEGVMATRDALREHVLIELVAFPQSGLLRRAGTLELMDQALAAGAEVVGGLDPCGIDRDPKGHLDAVFGLAQKHGKPVDIHLHEPGELGAFSMDLIIERTRALGMGGHVVVSHAFCLGAPESDALIAAVAQAGIAIMTTGSASRPVPPVAKLARAGVVTCSGSDGIRDTWGPYGNGDMVERAMLLGLRNNFRREEEMEQGLRVCTEGGAAAMRLSDYGLAPGSWADLVLMPAETLASLVVDRSPDRTVLRRGRIVAERGVTVMRAP
jgi:cytosine/creatinine deaminase